ncbi:translation initiation factor Sui1 [Thermodesulfobacteriota bacterium]
MGNSRLVYSTESGRICPSCGNPTATCTCKKKKVKKKQPVYQNDGVIRIRREVKGRKGKTVTAIFGVTLDDKELKQFAKILKRRCGTGGTVKDGVIIIQGDHRETLLQAVKKQGYTVKLAGA